MYRSLGWVLSLLLLSGCATIASQFTLDNSLALLQQLLAATSMQQPQLANPEQQQQLSTLKSEVDSVIRTVSEASSFPPENRQQVYLSTLPLVNSSLGKAFDLSKAIALQLGNQTTLNALLNDKNLQQAQQTGNTLVEMYKNLTVVKRDMLLELNQSPAVDKLKAEYAGGVQLLKELCAVKTGTYTAAIAAQNCLKVPDSSLPEVTPASAPAPVPATKSLP